MTSGKSMDNIYKKYDEVKQQYNDLVQKIVDVIGVDNFQLAESIRTKRFVLLSMLYDNGNLTSSDIEKLQEYIPDIDITNKDIINSQIDQELMSINELQINALGDMYDTFTFDLTQIYAKKIAVKFQINGHYGKN